MDVVRSKVESLKGSVQLGMKPGQGTTFTIRLPMTLALATGGTVKAVDFGDYHVVRPDWLGWPNENVRGVFEFSDLTVVVPDLIRA